MPEAPATWLCPDETICRRCWRPIWWNDYSYIHAGGDADCVRNNRTTSAQPIQWSTRV